MFNHQSHPVETIGVTSLLEDEVRLRPSRSEFAQKRPSPLSRAEFEGHCKKKVKRSNLPHGSNATPRQPTVTASPTLPLSSFVGTPLYVPLMSALPYSYAYPRESVTIPMLPPIPNVTTSPVVFQIPPAMHVASARVRKQTTAQPIPAQPRNAYHTRHLQEIPNFDRRRNSDTVPPISEESHRWFALLGDLAHRNCNRQPTRAAGGRLFSTNQSRPQLRHHPVMKVRTTRSLNDSLESHDRPVSPISGVYPLCADSDDSDENPPSTWVQGDADSRRDGQQRFDEQDDNTEPSESDDEYIDVCN
jgi:hypothetical protein